MVREANGPAKIVATALDTVGGYLYAPPSGRFADATLRRGAALRLLRIPDGRGRMDMLIYLTDAEYEQLRAVFPDMPVSDVQGGVS